MIDTVLKYYSTPRMSYCRIGSLKGAFFLFIALVGLFGCFPDSPPSNGEPLNTGTQTPTSESPDNHSDNLPNTASGGSPLGSAGTHETGGTVGSGGVTGSVAGAGGLGGSGGVFSGGSGGSGGVAGTGGTGGSSGTGGSGGLGGPGGSGGTRGSGGTGGRGGSGGSGGTVGSGGSGGTSGSGGSGGSGGLGGSGGSGTGGSGGSGGTEGSAGSGGSGGAGGCAYLTNRGDWITWNPTVTGRRYGDSSDTTETRRVSFYIPQSRPAHSALVIMIHGTGGTARDPGDNSGIITESGANDLALCQGVVIAGPEAPDRGWPGGDYDHPPAPGDPIPWGKWWETYPNNLATTNMDLMLIQQIINYARTAYAIDSTRIYILGHSNGGFFATLAGVALRDQVAGWAASSSGLVSCATRPDCSYQGSRTSCADILLQCSCSGVSKPIDIPSTGFQPAVYWIHGNADPQVSAYYSCVLDRELRNQGFSHISTTIVPGGGHSVPFHYASEAWQYLSQFHH